jgi:hypothetical protein
MIEVRVNPKESVDAALARFKQICRSAKIVCRATGDECTENRSQLGLIATLEPGRRHLLIIL